MDKTEAIESHEAAFMMLEGAEKSLDLKRGAGYAEAHPEIVAGFSLAIALDCHAKRTAALLGDLATSLGRLSGE